MDIKKSLSFAFDDEKWLTRLGTGAIIVMLPVLNIAWNGYTLEVMRRAIAGRADLLPDWDDLGKKWMDGLYLALAGFIYALPGFFLVGIPFAVLAVPAFIQDSDSQALLAILTTTAGLLLFGFAFLYFLLLSLVLPAIQLNFSQSGNLKSCFEIGKVVRWIRSNPGEYLTAWVSALAAGLLIGIPIGLISLLIGWVPCLGQLLVWLVSALGTTWLAVFSAHLFGQFGAETITPAPPQFQQGE